MGTDDAESINPKGQGAAAHPLSPWQGAPSPLYLHPAHPHLPMVLGLWFGGLIAQKTQFLTWKKARLLEEAPSSWWLTLYSSVLVGRGGMELGTSPGTFPPLFPPELPPAHCTQLINYRVQSNQPGHPISVKGV